jgi:LPXTG-site transpeptidase (sortase) family protein
MRRAGVMLVLCLAVLAAGCRGGGSDGQTKQVTAVPSAAGPDAPPSGATFPEAAATATPETPGESAQETAPALPAPDENAQFVRLVIPKAKVDSRIVTKGLNDRREMEDPGGKDVVAWYNFSTLPGYGSNAVLSAHVDWYTGERGAFWFLRDLAEGDDVEVRYSDGTTVRYRVSRVAVYPANDAPVAEITGPTTKDVLTMITCDGVFSRSSGDYNQRRVVWAERYA